MSDGATLTPAVADVGEGLSTSFGPAAAAAPSVDTGGGGFWSSLANVFGGGGAGAGGGISQTALPPLDAGAGGAPMPTGAAPTPAVTPGMSPAALMASTYPGAEVAPEGWSLTPEGSQAAARLAGAGAAAKPAGFFDWMSKNVLQPYQDVRKSGLFDLLGAGTSAASLISQIAKMQGGQTPLDPLQQERLNALRMQQNQAQQFLTGQVPATMQQNLQQQTQAEMRAIKSRYAQMGMSGSTSEMQDLAAAQARGTARLGQAQSQLISTGAGMLGIPQQQLASLTREQLAQDAAFNDALAKFVAALAGGPPQRAAA